MTYAANESTGGEPVELYDFVAAGVHYRYTSSDVAVVITAGAAAGTYTPEVLLRNTIQATDENATNATVQVTVARGTAVAELHAFDRAPDPPMDLTIFRYHRDDADAEVVVIFSGSVSSVEQVGDTAQLLATPEESVMTRTIPTRHLQVLCNHFLFDTGCTLVAADFAVAGTLGRVSFDGLTLTITAAGSHPDQYFTLGYLVALDGTTRAIAAQVGDQITLVQRLPEGTWAIGDAVTLYPGCDRLYTTCRDKFANVPNFFGFPFIPRDDPFRTAMV